ncbi:MAG: hypothetical protein JRI68_33285 [Deltaproteobacteria bacterium]|nr:hypothetical protein [Deltaproteobacteria bacterium]
MAEPSVVTVLAELLSRVGVLEGVIGVVERRLEALLAPAQDEEPKGDSD